MLLEVGVMIIGDIPGEDLEPAQVKELEECPLMMYFPWMRMT